MASHNMLRSYGHDLQYGHGSTVAGGCDNCRSKLGMTVTPTLWKNVRHPRHLLSARRDGGSCVEIPPATVQIDRNSVGGTVDSASVIPRRNIWLDSPAGRGPASVGCEIAYGEGGMTCAVPTAPRTATE